MSKTYKDDRKLEREQKRQLKRIKAKRSLLEMENRMSLLEQCVDPESLTNTLEQ